MSGEKDAGEGDSPRIADAEVPVEAPTAPQDAGTAPDLMQPQGIAVSPDHSASVDVMAPTVVPPEPPVPPSLEGALSGGGPQAPKPPSYDGAELARALLVFALVGASIALFITQIVFHDSLVDFISKNEIPKGRRRALELAMVGGAGLLVAAAGAWLLPSMRHRDLGQRVPRLHRVACFILPLTLAFALPPLFRWQPWSKDSLNFLLVAAPFGLALERMLFTASSNVPQWLVRAGETIRERTPSWLVRYGPPVVVGLAAVGYTIFFSYFTILHHRRFGTACYDLGQYDNLFYNAMRGHPFRIPSLSGEHDWRSLGSSHAEVSLYALLPFYAIKPGSETLLIIQATLLGSAAIPLYLFGTRFISRGASMLVALAYVFYAPLHRSNFYDFHMQPIAAAFILWMLYFLVAKKNVAFWIAFVFAVNAREDISVGLAILGTFLVLTGYRPRVGAVMAVVSVAYFVAMRFVIMPRFGTSWFPKIYKDLQVPGTTGYGSIVETIVSNPMYVLTTLFTKAKLNYVMHILLPLAFLPIRRVHLAMSVIQGSLFTILTTGYNPTTSIQFQYNAHWIAYIFPASVLALSELGRERTTNGNEPDAAAATLAIRRRFAALGAVLVLCIAHSYQFGALLQRNNFQGGFLNVKFELTDKDRERYAQLRELVKVIPKDASVAATEHLAPHVSTRKSLYCLRDSPGIADYIVYARFDRSGKSQKVVQDLLAKKKFAVIADRGDIIILKKGADPATNDTWQSRL